MRLPVQTAEWLYRGGGAPVIEVGVHESATGSYRPPFPSRVLLSPRPPHTMTRLPVQTLVCQYRPGGAPVVEVGVHVSTSGSYRPPVMGT
jgi:hypothetical protein